MFEVTLLSTKDKKQWLRILDGFELKDPHYLPGYLEIYEKVSGNRESFMHFGGRGMLFVYGDSRNFIIYPFIKRSISLLPFADNSVKHLYDISSPHGYGGPLAQIENETISEELWRGFFDKFDDFCKEGNIVSEFGRLHPIYENHRPVGDFSQGITQQVSQIVYIDLSCSEEEIFAAMSKHHRRHARRALQNPDLRFYVDEEDYHPQFFSNLYTETMRRIRAHKKYFFPPSFFEAVFLTLGEHLSFHHVDYSGEVVSELLTLKYGDLAYSWLSGSEEEALHLYPNNLLLYGSILQSKKEGFKYFILGGGAAATQDSLFAFKAGFSKLTKDFYVYKRIHLKKEYERLVKVQRYKGEIPEDFFPQYRLSEATIGGYRTSQGMEEENE